jgi:TRAP-type C4-dicarboxylate transport system substrate-binding protein
LAFAGVLGGDREIVEQCKLGMLDMVFSSDIGYSTVVKAVGFAAMPYLFETYEDADKLYFHGLIGEEFKKRLLKGGNIRLLSWGENDFRALTNNKRPILEVKDLHGLKIRTPEFPMLISFFRNLGALPTPIPYPELFIALQQGTVDGQDNGVKATYYTRLYEFKNTIPLPIIFIALLALE